MISFILYGQVGILVEKSNNFNQELNQARKYMEILMEYVQKGDCKVKMK